MKVYWNGKKNPASFFPSASSHPSFSLLMTKRDKWKATKKGGREKVITRVIRRKLALRKKGERRCETFKIRVEKGEEFLRERQLSVSDTLIYLFYFYQTWCRNLMNLMNLMFIFDPNLIAFEKWIIFFNLFTTWPPICDQKSNFPSTARLPSIPSILVCPKGEP